jgi:hypothetical protein
MGRPRKADWRQSTLLDDAAPERRDLPSEIRPDVLSAVADLLLAHLHADTTPPTGERDESEDQS